MYFDMVCPNGNEDEFIAMAKKMGYRGICFICENIPEEKKHDDNLQIFYGIKTKDPKNARKSADFVIAKDVENPRLYVEKNQPDAIFGVEKLGRKDFMHQRNSGADHIISELAKKKGVGFGFCIKDIMDNVDKPKVIGRVMQNIKLFEKYDVKTFICSMADEPIEMRNQKDIESLFSWLGMRNPKIALNNLPETVEKNRKIREGKLAEGVEVVD